MQKHLRTWGALAALALTGAIATGARAQNSPVVPITNGDCTATDALGRTLPTFAQVGPPKPGRWVGMFYWQWHGPDRWGPDYDMTKFLQTHPRFMDFQANPPGGPNNQTWYWAEPLFGYYSSLDTWVMRKHLVMLADAGVDFLFLDYTNGSVYDAELKAFLDVARDLKAKGVAVPKLVFFLNNEPEWKAEHLYQTWYAPGKYNDLWFQWQGKPLMMSPMPTEGGKFKNAALLTPVQSYFTWRPTWAFQDAKTEPTKWRFMDDLKDGGRLRPALGPDGKPEQIVVNKSTGGPIWDNMKEGGVSTYPGHVPTYNDQWLSGDQAKGLFFQTMWNNALHAPAPILLVTGWNEWTASVWETPGVVMLGRTTVKGQGHIVDEFNMDFNRDIEPMQGGYGDDYYWQFVANMRRYKGMQKPQAPSAPKAIAVEKSWAQWNGVRPVYRDTKGDIANRDADGVTPHAHYTDTSARNDIVLAQAARSGAQVAFRVQTADVLSPASGKHWMMLLVDTDSSAKTGWEGYNLLVNRTRKNGLCSVEQCVGNQWQWKTIGYAPLRFEGRDLMVSIPRRLLGQGTGPKPLAFNFKWVDNLPDEPSVMDFYKAGDAAPNARLSYHYAAPSSR